MEEHNQRLRFRVVCSSSRSSIGLLDTGRRKPSSSAVTMEVGICDSEVSPGLQQIMHSSVNREGVVAGAQEGDEAVKGPDCNPQHGTGADHVHPRIFYRAGFAIPDTSIEEDVGDRVKRAEAVAIVQHSVEQVVRA